MDNIKYKGKSWKIVLFLIISIFVNFTLSKAEIVKKIEILGNDRISEETIKLFSEIQLNQNVDQNILNQILKNLYNTNFFKNVDLKVENNVLFITVKESPIIENITIEGIKSQKLTLQIKENALIRTRSSYNEYLLSEEKTRLQKLLKEIGYYNAKIDILTSEEKNNLVNLKFSFDLGNKAKVKKITFIGNKIFKDRKLRRIIASTEYKYWKFLSGRKFLNENLVLFDERLLKNFYKNNGYYNVKVNSSFAKLLKEDEFELVFNIDAKNKIYFGELKLNLPSDFDENNFNIIKKTFW